MIRGENLKLKRKGDYFVVQSSLRDLNVYLFLVPPINWWAIFDSPDGTKNLSILHRGVVMGTGICYSTPSGSGGCCVVIVPRVASLCSLPGAIHI